MPNLPLILIVSVVVLLNGSVSHIMCVSYMTPVSALVSVPFPQLSPHVCSYHPIILVPVLWVSR